MSELEYGVPPEQRLPSWRAIASAWAVAVFILVLIAGIGAHVLMRPAAETGSGMAGVVIPRHEAACDPTAPVMSRCRELSPKPFEVPPISGW